MQHHFFFSHLKGLNRVWSKKSYFKIIQFCEVYKLYFFVLFLKSSSVFEMNFAILWWLQDSAVLTSKWGEGQEI